MFGSLHPDLDGGSRIRVDKVKVFPSQGGGGLIVNTAEDTSSKVVVTKIGTDMDKRIKEFKSSNVMDMFQRQISLVFSPLENYTFGSGTIDFPMWFVEEFRGSPCGDAVDQNGQVVFE